MVLSKRERYISIATAAVVAVLALDYFFVSPNLLERELLGEKLDVARKQAGDDRVLLERSRLMGRRWAELSRGPLKGDASETESQVLHSVRDWAQEAGMSLSSVKPDRTEKDKDLVRITLRATGTGTMEQVGRFLYLIQTATIPVRVADLQITARKEGTDDLAIQLGISTIYLAPADPAKPRVAYLSSAREVTP